MTPHAPAAPLAASPAVLTPQDGRDGSGAAAVLRAGLVLCTVSLVPHATPLADDFMYPKELALHLVALAAALLCLRGARTLRVGTEDVLLAGFALLGLLSHAAAEANGWLGTRALAISTSGLAVFWCARALARRGHAPALLGAGAAAVLVLAASVLLEAYGGAALSMPGRFPGGVLGHRNSAAHLVVLGLPLLALLASAARGRASLVLLHLGLAMGTAALVLSRSRGAWLSAALVAVLAAVLLVRMRDRLRPAPGRVGTVAGALVAGVVLAVALPNRLEWRAEHPHLETLRTLADHTSGSGRGRVVQYARTLGMIGDQPLLGVGPGNWTVRYPRYAAADDPSYRPRDLVPTPRLPQGDWIGVAAERGLPALLLLALAGCALAARAAGRLARESTPPGERGRAMAALCILLGLAALGSLDPVLLQPLHVFFVAVVLGVLVPPGRGWRVMEWRPLPRVAAACAVVALLAGPVLVGARQTWAARMLARSADPGTLARAARVNAGDYRLRALLAVHWVRERRCDLALPHIRQAAALFPTAPAPREMEAGCLRALGAAGARPAE